MRFWDASAIVPLLVPERRSRDCEKELARDRSMIIWGLTPLEALSAVHRKHRQAALSQALLAGARQRLQALRSTWSEIRDLSLVSERAERLLAIHDLRAADALQLAAALLACDEKPAALPFLSLDDRLSAAAAREWFRVLP